MPIPKPGDTRKSPTDEYEIVKELNRGAFAFAFKAKSRRTGQPVFFKRYIEPKPSLEWYQDFVNHQKTLKEQVSSSDSVQQYCYRFIDFFEAENHFFQVFEFVDGGIPLTDVISGLTASPGETTWEQRVRFARVMMLGVAGLHSRKIVHTDLKPDNLLLVPNPHTPGEFFLRVIDMDWAIFSDRRAPWHGRIGYIGTPGYQSPEHLRQEVPTEASDVFTCGIMLSELLGGGHPFSGEYEKSAISGEFKPFTAQEPIAKIADLEALENLISACLHADPKARPTATELKDGLLGKPVADRFKVTRPVPAEPPKPPPPPPDPKPRSSDTRPVETPPPKPSPTSTVTRISLMFEGKAVLSASIETRVGRAHLKSVSEDYKYLGDPQFRLFRDKDAWMVAHEPGAANETIVEGKPIGAPMRLEAGMRITVGKSAKGIEKMPLIVSFSA